MRQRTPAFVLLLLLLAWLLAACDPLALPTPTPSPAAPTPIPTATTEPTITPEPTPTSGLPVAATESATPETAVTPGTPGPVSEEIQREVADIESDTAKLRGLTPKKDVQETFIPQAQMKANLADETRKDYTPEEAKRDATALWLMRLLNDPSIDLRQLEIDLLGEQVLGYYDHKKHDLFVRSDETTLSPLARETLAHEFTHALQDQYYDLQKLRPDKMENDKGTAVLSIIEGDASASGLLYAKQFMTPQDFQKMLTDSANSSTKELDSAPRYIRESLLFPYDQGIQFVTALLTRQPGSFKAIDAALADPPQSSEQILHPEKYLDEPRDLPTPVALPPLTDTLGIGWTQRNSDTMGEFDLGVMLKDNGVEESTATEAAVGWGGGRYALYENGNASLLILGTTWDTNTDATEFNDAMQASLASLKKDGTLWSDGKRFFAITRSGDKITYIAGTDKPATERALSAK